MSITAKQLDDGRIAQSEYELLSVQRATRDLEIQAELKILADEFDQVVSETKKTNDGYYTKALKVYKEKISLLIAEANTLITTLEVRE